MNRNQYENTHEEALNRLCFVCANVINLDVYYYKVENSLDLLGVGLKCPGIFSIPGVTPYHICQKCNASLLSVMKGLIVKASIQLLDWGECGENCETCSRMLKRKVNR